MANDVQIDFAVVQTMADVMSTTAETLGIVNNTLMGIEGVLAASAFIGFVGGAAAAYIENIRESVSSISDMATELNSDLNGAIKALRDGDFSGSQRFV